MKKLCLGLLAFHLAFLPLHADVIPSRRAERDAAAEQAVKSRLQDLGLSKAQIQSEIDGLNPQETAYFAEQPERLQPVGGLYWYEFIIGLAVLVALGVVYFWVVD
jgi:hypothetical protein